MLTTNVLTAFSVFVSFMSIVGVTWGVIYTNRKNYEMQLSKALIELTLGEREKIRLKGEELCMLLDSYHASYFDWSGSVAQQFSRDPRTTTLSLPDFSKAKAHLARIEMLSCVYFPKLSPTAQELKGCLENVGNLILRMPASKTYELRRRWVGELFLVGNDVIRLIQKLQQEVIVEVRVLHQEHQHLPQSKTK